MLAFAPLAALSIQSKFPAALLFCQSTSSSLCIPILGDFGPLIDVLALWSGDNCFLLALVQG